MACLCISKMSRRHGGSGETLDGNRTGTNSTITKGAPRRAPATQYAHNNTIVTVE